MLKRVLENIVECSSARPQLLTDVIVFDNASTQPNTLEQLLNVFPRVHSSSRNVGYWTALDWILRHRGEELPTVDYDLIYVIESDMIHYDIAKLAEAEAFLRAQPDVGAVRCMEYSVADMHLYDKSRPVKGGRRWAWQNHSHLVTGQRIEHVQSSAPGIYLTTFLTQLPALNRLSVLDRAFEVLRSLPSFTEHDFQRACFEQHRTNALIDGGIFDVKLTAGDETCLSGSWSSQQQLSAVGYKETRRDVILPSDDFVVNVVERSR